MLFRRLGLVLAVYTAVRAAFLVSNRVAVSEADLTQVLGAFARGLRFDLSAIAYSNIPFILLSLAPVTVLARAWYQRLLFALFVLVNGALTVVNVGDVGYYPFTGTRVTMEVFALTGEATAQAGQLFVNFWMLTVFGIGLVAVLVLGYPRAAAAPAPRPARLAPAAAARFAVLLLVFLAARGGWQKKPLKPIHAFTSGSHEVGILTLNSAFTLIHSPRERPLAPVEHFADVREAEALLAAPDGGAARGSLAGQNVMFLILESFGTEFWGDTAREVSGLTPFLDSLAGQGLFFTNGFANGRRSMDALPSLLLGVPLLAGRSIAVSRYQSNEWRGLGHFLGDAGYHTSMYHGAPRGTMFFDAIAAMAGIEEFHPLERFPDDLQDDAFDGHWGLYDEPALQYVAEALGRQPTPWFSLAFTISTHHPYPVPEAYEGSLPSGPREIHQNVAYVDLALRRFFEAARQQPWFENTLFVITGDHTAPMRAPRWDTPLGRYMVPVLLFHPSRALPRVDEERVVQHVDLFATVLDLLDVRPERVPLFGRSIFSPVPGEAVIAADEVYWLVRRDGVVERHPDGRQRTLAYRREATGLEADWERTAVSDSLDRQLWAHVQHYTTAMIENTFYRVVPARSDGGG